MKKIMSLFLSLLMLLSVGVANVSAEEAEEHQHLSTSEGIIVKEATCKELGLIQYTCDECQESYQEEIPLKEHTYVDGICSMCGTHEPYNTWIIDKTDNQIYAEYIKLLAENNNDLTQGLLSVLSIDQQNALNEKLTLETQEDNELEQLEEPQMLMTAPLMGSAQNEGIKTAEAFGEALAKGGEIVLGDNVSYTTSNYGQKAEAILVSKDTTIDLNGFTLNITTASSAGRYSIYVDTDVTLTIKDSSPKNEGVMNVKSEYASKAAYIFYVYGTLDIQGGTINQEASYSSSYGVDIMSGSTFKMSGGKLSIGTKMKSGGYTLYASSGTKIITGGVIEEYYTGNTVSGWEVSGGIFKTQPTYEMMKAGNITYKITDEGTYKNWYGVKEGTYIGLVGTAIYTDVASFANAIGGSKISVNGTKLTLTDNIDLGSASANKVTFLSDITIDLAGHNIKGAIAGSSAYMFYVNQKDATVTITDSSERKTGMVKNATSSDCNTIGVNRGKFIVDHVRVIGTTTTNKSVRIITTLTSDAYLVLQNKAEIEVDCSNVVYPQYGIHIKYGVCEIDDSTINVKSGSSATAIYPNNATCTVKIGSKNTGMTYINVTSSGLNTSASSLAGIGYSSTGCTGNIYIANTEIKLKTEIGNESSKAQSCYGLGFAAPSNCTWEIGSDVSVSITGKSNAKPGSYGIYAVGGGTISGSNISFDVDTESEGKRVGIYLSNDKDFAINPGTNVSFQINRSGYETGNNLMVENVSTKGAKVLISGGLYKGGELSGITATGGVFDTDPSEFCDTGYVAKADTPSVGLWTVVPNVANLVKNTRLDKSYTSIADAVAEAEIGDELQLIDDISSSADLEINSINLDLNGHNLSLNKLITNGNVTITDKQATNFENAGTLTASVNVSSGNTIITKCNHSFSTSNASLNPYYASGTLTSPAQLTILGVNGAYSYTGSSSNRMIYVYDNSRVIIENDDGFETSLKFNSSGSSPTLVYGSENNAEVTINNGYFEITSSASTVFASVFGPNTKGVVNGGKFKLTSQHAAFAKIASNTNSTIDIQGGYFVGTGTQGEVTKDSFFTNTSLLGENGKNSVTLEDTDPMYAEGYRYTVDSVAVARIGETPYTSVQLAINAANTGDTITLLQNTVGRELILDKQVTFEGEYMVTLSGNKPLILGNGIDKPACFDVSATSAYLEKNNGEKVYYKDWLVNGGINTESTGLWVDYNADDYKQIVLTKDLQKTLVINKTCTIDLNGFTITAQSGSEALSIRGNITCTIKDTSGNKTGKIVSDAEGAGGYVIELNNLESVFILESGTIENTSDTGAGISIIGDGYHTPTNATVTINGGKISVQQGFAIVDNGQSSKNVNVTINGGEIFSKGVAIYHPASGTITLNGGKVAGETGIYIRSGKLVVPENSTAKVVANGNKTSHGTETGRAYNTGDAIVIDVSGYPGGSPSADIAGGAFYSLYNFAISSYSSYGNTPAIKGFLKGGIYGANQERIDIMDTVSTKDLIAKGYQDIPNPDKTTKEYYPWMIGAVHENETTVVIGNGDTPIEAEIDDTIIIVADTNDENTVVGAPGYSVEESQNDGKSTYVATALDIGYADGDSQDAPSGEGTLKAKKMPNKVEDVAGITEEVKTSARTVVDTDKNTQLVEIVCANKNVNNINNNFLGVLVSRGINQGTAAKALNNAGIAKVTNEGEGTDVAAKNISVFVRTYYDTEILEDKTNQTNKSFTLDITPMYQAYASTVNDITAMVAEEDESVDPINAVKIGESAPVDCTGKTINLKIELPTGFITSTSQKVYVIHTLANNGTKKTYNTTVTKESDKFYIEFTNPDGFSEFEITLKNPNPTPSPSLDSKPKYKAPKTGIEGTTNNCSLLKLSSLSLFAIGTYIAIKKKKDNEQ